MEADAAQILADSAVIEHLGDRLREARLNARLTTREAAARIGLRTHATLVQYENRKVLPPLDRLAALAQLYGISLAGLMVQNDALMPILDMLEQASASQLDALARLLRQALNATGDAG